MSDVLVFLADVIADVWDMFYNGFPRDFFTYSLLFFIIGLVISRLILPVIAVNEADFFGKGVVNEHFESKRKERKRAERAAEREAKRSRSD